VRPYPLAALFFMYYISRLSGVRGGADN
jgi:hypothetical protein